MNPSLPAAGPHGPAQQAYVIELGETQVGLVNRRADERFFTFIAAHARFHAIDGQRFASPGAAEQAARLLARPGRAVGPFRLAS